MLSNITSGLSLNGSPSQKNLKVFGLMLLITEIIILILYGAIVRIYPVVPDDDIGSQRYPAYQDIEVMIVIGFAYLMTYIKNNALSALSYTFLINALVIQFFMVFINFAYKLIMNAWSDPTQSQIGLVDYINACGCSAAMLIAFGGVIGKVGPKELLIMSLVCTLGYTLNFVVVLYRIQMIDAGGSSYIHIFGTYFGLAASYILSKKIPPIKKVKTSYNSLIFSMLGTLILWMYWPSFHFAGTAGNTYEELVIVINTIEALVGSCLGTFILTSLLGRKMSMEDILNATLAGGVAIGAVCSVSYYPVVAVFTGLLAGMISTYSIHYLTPYLQESMGLHDTCGIHNLHGVPGVLGGFLSAIVIAFYNIGYDQVYVNEFTSVNNFWDYGQFSFWSQAGRQIGGTVCSIAFGVVFGAIAGFIMLNFYNEKAQNFYEDSEYFDLEASGSGVDSESGPLLASP